MHTFVYRHWQTVTGDGANSGVYAGAFTDLHVGYASGARVQIRPWHDVFSTGRFSSRAVVGMNSHACVCLRLSVG